MKCLHILICLIVLSACTNEPPVNVNVSKDSSEKMLISAYTNNFKIGDPKFAKIVLDFYSEFDSGKLNNFFQYISDTLKMTFSDGREYDCAKDSAIKVLKQTRNSFNDCKTIPDAFVTVTFKDQPGTWVSVWGKQITFKTNLSDTSFFNENWRFDDAGKLIVRNQYTRKSAF